MTGAIKRNYHGRSVLTTWDISAEIYGNADRDNFRKLRAIFIDNVDKFVEGTDYLNVPRAVIVILGIEIDRALNRIGAFQLFTKSGVNKLLEVMGLSELQESLDDKFDEEEPQSGSDIIVEEVNKNEVQDESGVFSEGVLSLISYITTSKALFDARFADVEVGTVIFNVRVGAMQVVTNVISIPDTEKTMIKTLDIHFSTDTEKWELGMEDTIFGFPRMGIGGHRVLAEHGVDFLLSLKSRDKTDRLISATTDLKDLYIQMNEIRNGIEARLAGLTVISLP